jgi:hypothetical protein
LEWGWLGVPWDAIEVSVGVGLALREDPRYFGAPQQPIKAHMGNVVRLTFLGRGENGIFGPAYAVTLPFQAVTSSQTPGAFAVKPIRWATLLRSFGRLHWAHGGEWFRRVLA